MTMKPTTTPPVSDPYAFITQGDMLRAADICAKAAHDPLNTGRIAGVLLGASTILSNTCLRPCVQPIEATSMSTKGIPASKPEHEKTAYESATTPPAVDLADQLFNGCIIAKKRWSGDCGEMSRVDENATDKLMVAAAAELRSLRAKLETSQAVAKDFGLKLTAFNSWASALVGRENEADRLTAAREFVDSLTAQLADAERERDAYRSAVDKLDESNANHHRRAEAAEAALAAIKARQLTLGTDAIKEMTEAFLRWPLPYSVCSDGCATKQSTGRVGTNLLTYDEASQMIQAVVGEYLNERHHWFDMENTGLAVELEKVRAALAERDAAITALAERNAESLRVMKQDRALYGASNANLNMKLAERDADTRRLEILDRTEWHGGTVGPYMGGESVSIQFGTSPRITGKGIRAVLDAAMAREEDANENLRPKDQHRDVQVRRFKRCS